MNKIIKAKFDGRQVQFNPEGWLHATEIAEQFGKRLDHWMENAETLEYIRALDEAMTGGESEILDTRKSGYVKTSRARADRGGGTWLHPKLAVMFARWLDAKFAVWCDMQIDTLLRSDTQNIDARRLRHEAAVTYRVMSGFLQQSREMAGKDTATHHYMNEAKLIGYAMTGVAEGIDRDSLSLAELDRIAKVEKRNALLIGQGIEYAERKLLLREYAEGLRVLQIGGVA